MDAGGVLVCLQFSKICKLEEDGRNLKGHAEKMKILRQRCKRSMKIANAEFSFFASALRVQGPPQMTPEALKERQDRKHGGLPAMTAIGMGVDAGASQSVCYFQKSVN